MILLIVAYVVGWVIATAIIAAHMERDLQQKFQFLHRELETEDWVFAALVATCWPALAVGAPVVIAAQILKDEINARQKAKQT